MRRSIEDYRTTVQRVREAINGQSVQWTRRRGSGDAGTSRATHAGAGALVDGITACRTSDEVAVLHIPDDTLCECRPAFYRSMVSGAGIPGHTSRDAASGAASISGAFGRAAQLTEAAANDCASRAATHGVVHLAERPSNSTLTSPRNGNGQRRQTPFPFVDFLFPRSPRLRVMVFFCGWRGGFPDRRSDRLLFPSVFALTSLGTAATV